MSFTCILSFEIRAKNLTRLIFVVIKKMLYLCKQNFNDNKKAFLLIFGLFETWTISNRMPNK
jgi:hypothetical protein